MLNIFSKKSVVFLFCFAGGFRGADAELRFQPINVNTPLSFDRFGKNVDSLIQGTFDKKSSIDMGCFIELLRESQFLTFLAIKKLSELRVYWAIAKPV